MFWRGSRSSDDPGEPRRGPGGGKVRTRPRRRERMRRQPGLDDAVFIAAIVGVITIFLYRLVMHVSWPESLLFGLFVFVTGTAAQLYVQKFFDRRRKGRSQTPPTRGRK